MKIIKSIFEIYYFKHFSILFSRYFLEIIVFINVIMLMFFLYFKLIFKINIMIYNNYRMIVSIL